MKQVISRNGYSGTIKFGALRAKGHVYPHLDFLNVILTAWETDIASTPRKTEKRSCSRQAGIR